MTASPWENAEFAKLSLANIDKRLLPGTPQEVDFLVQGLSVSPGEKVLDLGCGAGRHCIEFASRGYHVVGLDISEFMLYEARKRAAVASVTVDFRMANLAGLDLGGDEHFRGAICICESGCGVLGGSEADMRFLRAVHGLLYPGAKLVVTCFNGLRRYLRSRDANPKFDYVSGVFHWEAPMAGRMSREDQRLYIPSELAMMLKICGFDDIQVYGTSPGAFDRRKLGIEDVEMMLIAKRGRRS